MNLEENTFKQSVETQTGSSIGLVYKDFNPFRFFTFYSNSSLCLRFRCSWGNLRQVEVLTVTNMQLTLMSLALATH